MPNASQADFLAGWEHFLKAAAANVDRLRFLDGHVTEMIGVVEAIKVTRNRQGTARAELQQSTRDLEDLLRRGRDLADRLRNGVRTEFGATSEKLVEFGMQPRRKPQRNSKKAKKETPPEPAPPTQEAA